MDDAHHSQAQVLLFRAQEVDMSHVRKSSVILAVTLFMVSGYAYAQPDVTNVPSQLFQGGTFSAQGTDFGEKIPAAPLRWLDFEEGVDRAPLPDNEAQGGVSTIADPYYSQGRQRIPGEMCALQDFATHYNQAIGLWDHGTDVDTLYFSGWNYRDDVAGQATSCSNSKLWGNWSHGGPATLSLPQARLDTYPYIDSGHLYAQRSSTEQIGVPTGSRLYLGEWFRLERYLEIGDPNTPNGYQYAAYNGDIFAENSGVFRVDANTYDMFWIGQYFRTDGGPLRVYWSEIYIDNTRSRIEIGDAQDWDACTHREIQIPVAWDGESVTFTANQGTFPADQPLYLFVVNKAGQPSVGHPVSFTSTIVDDGPPGQPGPMTRDS